MFITKKLIIDYQTFAYFENKSTIFEKELKTYLNLKALGLYA